MSSMRKISATSRAPTGPLGSIRLLEFLLVSLVEQLGDPSIGVKQIFLELFRVLLENVWDWDCFRWLTHWETDPLILRGLEKLVILPALDSPEPPKRNRGRLLVVVTDMDRLVLELTETRPTEHLASGDSRERGLYDETLWFLWKDSGRDRGE